MIYLAFTDDWEIRGNGTGDPRVLQFEPMRRLVKIFNNHGIRASFNAEVMQQLAHRNQQERFPELKTVADEWEQVVIESFRQGHDIQLHLHPQWHIAEYKGPGHWVLNGDWSILQYSRERIRKMLSSGKQYLENLLRPIDPAYNCVSFRAGSWCIAPSDSVLPILGELGILFDMSIVAGIRYSTPRITFDYRECEEPFVPYYPDMKDARRLSHVVEPIVCVPTNTFWGARLASFRYDYARAIMALRHKCRGLGKRNSLAASLRGRSGDEWTTKNEAAVVSLAKRVLKRYIMGQRHIADLSRMNYAMMCRMMSSIRTQVAKSGLARVPIILVNHTKDISDFSDIERFVADVARSADVKTVTLTEIANALRSGVFEIRTA